MDKGYFPVDRPALSVDVVLFRLNENRIETLLICRGKMPFKDKWALPGGFVQSNESLDAAARRELHEETGLSNIDYLEQLYTFGTPKRDPRGRVVTVAYFALIPTDVNDPQPEPGDDAALAAWHPIRKLPDLAFDHKDIIKYAYQRLRYKLEYTSVGFRLLPAEFTLTELQNSYEIVLGESLDKRNFRRRILESEIIEEVGKYRSGQVGPRAHLYRYRDDAVVEAKARRLFP